jgi:hypothetical protein
MENSQPPSDLATAEFPGSTTVPAALPSCRNCPASPTPSRSLPLSNRASPRSYVLHRGLLHAGSPSALSSASRPWLCIQHGFGFYLKRPARPQFCVVRLNLRKLSPPYPQLRSLLVHYSKLRLLGSRPSSCMYRHGCALLPTHHAQECLCPCHDQPGSSSCPPGSRAGLRASQSDPLCGRRSTLDEDKPAVEIWDEGLLWCCWSYACCGRTDNVFI